MSQKYDAYQHLLMLVCIFFLRESTHTNTREFGGYYQPGAEIAGSDAVTAQTCCTAKSRDEGVDVKFDHMLNGEQIKFHDDASLEGQN